MFQSLYPNLNLDEYLCLLNILHYIRNNYTIQEIVLFLFEVFAFIFIVFTILYSFSSVHYISTSSTMNDDIREAVITKWTNNKKFDKKYHIDTHDIHMVRYNNKLSNDLKNKISNTGNTLHHVTQQGIITDSVTHGLIYSIFLYFLFFILYVLWFSYTYRIHNKYLKIFLLNMIKIFCHQMIGAIALVSLIIAMSKAIFLPYFSRIGIYIILLYNPCVFTILSIQIIISAHLYKNVIRYKQDIKYLIRTDILISRSR